MTTSTALLGGSLFSDDRTLAESCLLPNAAYPVALRMRENGKRMPLPDEWIDPCRYTGTGWKMPRRTAHTGPVEDLTVLPGAPAVTVGIVLRPYQREALRAWWRGDRNGVIVAPCGGGKTAIGLVAAAVSPTPCLVIVHTGDLLRQWADRGCSAGFGDVATISEGGDLVMARLVIATMQTLIQYDGRTLESWGAGFGLIIVDECHHCPCATLCDVLYALPGRWRLGLSATPERADGLTPILFGHLGPIVATVDRAALVAAGVTIAPRVRRVDTGWVPADGLDYGEMITAATEDPDRNDLIVDIVAGLVAQGRHVLVQTERVEHAKLLAERIGTHAVAVYGALSAKKRTLILSAVADGSLLVLVATQLADEGLDLPILDALVLAVPQRNAARLEQRIGRVSRSAPGKVDSLVVDLIDDAKTKLLAYARNRVYREIGCTREGFVARVPVPLPAPDAHPPCPRCGRSSTLYYQPANNAIRAQCVPCGRYVAFVTHATFGGDPSTLPVWHDESDDAGLSLFAGRA